MPGANRGTWHLENTTDRVTARRDDWTNSPRLHWQHTIAAPERLGRNYPNAEFYGKAEWFNPGGSVKDRPALEMIRVAEREGKLKPGSDDS